MRIQVLALLALVGCVAGCRVDGDDAARVGGRGIPIDVVQTYLEAVTGSEWQDVDDQVASRVMDQYLDQEVVVEAVSSHRDLRLPDNPGERSAVVRSLLEETCGSPPEISAAEIAMEVTRLGGRTVPRRAKVRQLLLDDEQTAHNVCERLRAGEDFLALSRELSFAPNAATGGDLGYLEQGGLPDPLDQVIFALELGEFSEPVQGPSGYHVFQVLEVMPGGPVPMKDLERELRRELTERRMRSFVKECIGQLADEAGVKVYEDKLWFHYQGRYSKKGVQDAQSN